MRAFISSRDPTVEKTSEETLPCPIHYCTHSRRSGRVLFVTHCACALHKLVNPAMPPHWTSPPCFPLLLHHLTCGWPTISSATSRIASRNWGQLRVGVAGRCWSVPGDPGSEAARSPAGDQGVPEALGPTWAEAGLQVQAGRASQSSQSDTFSCGSGASIYEQQGA
jgi:hypothetical protein